MTGEEARDKTVAAELALADECLAEGRRSATCYQANWVDEYGGVLRRDRALAIRQAST
jgi:hypothetical protein